MYSFHSELFHQSVRCHVPGITVCAEIPDAQIGSEIVHHRFGALVGKSLTPILFVDYPAEYGFAVFHMYADPADMDSVVDNGKLKILRIRF